MNARLKHPVANLKPSTEELLISGGDSRLILDPATGLNRYGCAPHPRDAIPFGSCTSSSPSPRGFAAAERAREQLLTAEDQEAFARTACQTIRKRVRELLTLPDEIDVALAPSGTDVELLALALAAGGGHRPIVNFVIGPKEVGSGTPLAAAGCHYDTIVPSGADVVSGEPVSPHLASRVCMRGINLRTDQGVMLEEDAVDELVTELVAEASSSGAIVILHVVAHSKTGMHAPSLQCVDRLCQRFPDVVVAIDAAQGRFSRRGLREVLQKGYLVLFTGSKFYGGPPFSGTLLVPPNMHPQRRGLDALPFGFHDYFTAAEMPPEWKSIAASLPARPNAGTILRWCAALAELEAYYEAPADRRLTVLREFEADVPRIFGESDVARLIPVFPPVHDDNVERLLESKTTVFNFWVQPPGCGRTLNKSELADLHKKLNADVSAEFPDLDADLLSRTFHVGQPVNLAGGGFVLRVALGGELIVRVSCDATIGETFPQRLDWLRHQLTGLRSKVEALARTVLPAAQAQESR